MGWLRNNRNYFSQFWKLESQRLKCQEPSVLIQAFLVVYSWWLLTKEKKGRHLSHGGKEWASFWGVFHKALISFMRILPSWLKYLPKSHFLIPLHWGIGCQHMNLGEHKHSDQSGGGVEAMSGGSPYLPLLQRRSQFWLHVGTVPLTCFSFLREPCPSAWLVKMALFRTLSTCRWQEGRH